MGWGIGRTPAPRGEMHRVVAFGAAVVGLALVLMIIGAALSAGSSLHCTGDTLTGCFSAGQYILVFVPPAVLAAGAIGAVARTLVVWRRRGPWMLWHGATWFLLVVMLVYVGFSGGALMR